jgi:O-antigen/teichoic acid export membrane protein
MNEKKTKIRSNLLYNGFFTFVNILYPVLLFSYVSRIVGPDIFGKLNFAAALAAYFTLLGGCAVAPYGSREIARARHDNARVSGIVSELFSLNCITVVLSLSLFLVIVSSVGKFQKDWLLFAITGVNIVFCGVSPDWFFQGTENYRSIALRNAIAKLATLLCVVVFVKNKDDYLVYAAISAASNIAYFAIAFFICRKAVELRFNLRGVQRHFRPLMFLTASLWMVSIYSYLDSVYLGFMVNERAVGMYTVGMKVNRLLIVLVTSIGAVLTPRISYYLQQQMHAEYEAIILRSFRLIVLLAVPIGALVFLLAPRLVPLIAGDKFNDAVVTVRLGSPLIIIVACANWLNVCLMIPNRRDKTIFISSVCAVSASILMNILLVPLFAYNGTALASIAAESTACLVLVAAAWKTIRRLHLIDAKIFTYVAAAIAGCVPVSLICVFIRNNGAAALSAICCMGIIYVGALLYRRDDIVVDALRTLRGGIVSISSKEFDKEQS